MTVLTITCRELLRRVSAAKLRETNPKCEVIYEIKSTNANPTVNVLFSELKVPLWSISHCFVYDIGDGSDMNFECINYKALEMVDEINTRCRAL